MKGESLVRMENIRVKFGNVTALQGVNFQIKKNEVVGLLGDNGAGKSTLIKTLMGLYPFESGEIYLEGKLIEQATPMKAREYGIEVVYQDLAVIDKLSIARNFYLGREPEKRVGIFSFLDGKKMRHTVPRVMQDLGFRLEKPVTYPMALLSGGSRQTVAIARAFYFCKKILVLDEPTAALTEGDIDTLLRLVQQAKRDGLSVLFITHKAHEVFQVADRFVILKRGKILVNIQKSETHLKEIEKLLISSRLSAVREMAAGVAHQVRNPLGIVKVSAEILRDDFAPREQAEEYYEVLNTVFDEIETLELIVSNFLDFAHVHTPHRKEIEVDEFMRRTIDGLPLHKFEKVRLKLRNDDPHARHLMDASLLSQALTNIILNALEVSPENGEVEVGSRMEDGLLRIWVRDEGPGMDEVTRKKIFQPFFTTKTSGSGLGLAIVHKIIESQNGRVECFSAPGEGSTFYIVM